MRSWGYLAFLTIYISSSSEGLSNTGAHVCHHTVTNVGSYQERYTSHCGFLNMRRCSHHRTRYRVDSRVVYECCPGWRSTNGVDCSTAICYDKDNTNGACNQRGSCVAPNKCSCHTGYTGSQCEKCLDARGDSEHSIWWNINSHPDCALTCSWKNQWCWPGDCPDAANRNLRTNCKCRAGFVKKDGGSSYTKCDLTYKPELLSCHIGMTDEHHSIRNSTHGSNTRCSHETDTYVNLKPNSVYYLFFSKFDNIDITKPPNYVYDQGYGIVTSWAKLKKILINGAETSLSTVSLHGGSDCSKALSDTSPSSNLACSRTQPISIDMLDGERLCVQFSTTGGGFFKYQDFDGHPVGTQIYSHQSSTKQLCFRYDIGQPVHCSKLNTGHCMSQPLELSTRITRTGVFHVKTFGWSDPVPKGGKTDAASGLKYTKIKVLKTEHKGNVIDVIHTPLKGLDLKYDNKFQLDIPIHLPNANGLYAVILEVHDTAGNIQNVRRLVLYDNSSKLMIIPSQPLQVVSATKKSSYKWQTNLGPVCVDWKGRYYNDEMRANNPLDPVRPQVEVSPEYDQTSGTLPISGTPNVDGIVEAKYFVSVDHGAKSHWALVPNFTKQSLCISPKLFDGHSYNISIKIKDIVNSSVEESVRVYIDSTGPDVTNMWLVKDGNKQVYVHDSLDLSTMVLQFDVIDPHSGIQFVEWYLGTKDSSEDLGHGVLPVEKLNGKPCPSNYSCYCPSIGECQFHNYSVKLNGLVANKTNHAQHNQAFYFTVVSTNEADLRTIDHLDILVDTSPPEAGTVKEGGVDGPDVDYTSEDTVLVNWAGFIDHESGINNYLVGLDIKCLTLDDMKNITDVINIPGSINTAQFTIREETSKYYATVVAFNAALTPSKAACSDGIIRDISPPSFYNVILRSAQTSTEHVVRLNGDLWLVKRNLTLNLLQKTSECSQRCKSGSTSTFAYIFPKVNGILNDTEMADSLCRYLPSFEDSVIFLPSDKIELQWNCSENESQMRDFSVGFGSDKTAVHDPDILDYASSKGRHSFKLNHAGFSGKNIFYIFLKAVNKAGLTSVVTFGPVMIDNTPPAVTEILSPKSSGDFVIITWNNMTFTDSEQQDSQFTVLYRIVHDGVHVTPILQTPKHITKACQIQGHAGCIRYPLTRLQEMDSELNKPFLFELYVYNSAGHFTIVNTKKITVPSRFPPGHGIVYDIDPLHEDSKDDVEFHSTQNKSCVKWNGFHHHGIVQFEVALGAVVNGSDISPFRVVNNKSVCITSPGLKPRVNYYATVRATSSSGTSYASSDGFIIIDQPSDEQFLLKVFDGVACDINIYNTFGLDLDTDTTLDINITRAYKASSSLGIGQRYIVKFQQSLSGKIKSDDVLFKSNGKMQDLATYEFVPLTHYPRFYITDSAVDTNNATIHMCSLDTDYTLSKNKVSSYWTYAGPWKVLTTHFEAALKERMHCENRTQCYKTLSSIIVDSGTDYADFTNMVLDPGKVYQVFVRPCFDSVCLPWKHSDGVKAITGLPKVTMTASFTNRSKSSCHAVTIHVDSIECEAEPEDGKTIIYQRSVADKRNNPLTFWQTDQSLATGKSDICIEDHVQSHSVISICVRVICPSGLSDTSCRTLQHTRKEGNRLVEVDQKDVPKIIKMMEKLQVSNLPSFDTDIAESNIKLAGVMHGLQGRTSTWYLMTDPHIPPDCKSDDKCITSVDKVGPVAKFHGRYLMDGMKYYICVQSENTRLTISECGDGVIIDDRPPIKGDVWVVNQQNGFLTETDVLVMAWSGFNEQESIFNSIESGITHFSGAIGTYPGGQDVLIFTNVGFVHTAYFWNITLENGKTYYANVKAYDRLGHSTSATSDAVMVDVTPPKTGDIFIGDTLDSHSVVSGDRLTVHWAGFEDPESGILSTYLSIGSTSTGTLSPSTKYTKTFADIHMKKFTDGHGYFAKLMITNRAGLTSTAVSNTFTVDTSPPTKGVVADGENANKVELDYQSYTDRYSCHWSGFDDPHSGLSSFHVSLGTQPYLDDVETDTHTGLGTEMSWTGDLPLGIKFYCSVEACNHAGLCSKSVSDGIILDNSPPVPGIVFVGHDGLHRKYNGHVSTLTARWFGFEDPETGINHFAWCVGTSTGKCDVLPSINNLLSDSVLKTGLKLPSGHPLYVTVNATNQAGLVATSTSDSFIVDASSPVVTEKPTFTSPYSKNISAVNVQWENSMLHLRWKFTDVDSPIQRHMVSLSTHHDGSSAIENIHICAQDSTTILFKAGNLMRSGDVYTATVTACNAADLCSTATSNQIRIDSTPPHLGGFESPMVWESITDTGVTKTRFNLIWLGFTDTESGIQAYFISVSRTFDGTELSNGIAEIPHDKHTTEQSSSFILSDQIRTGENIILTISATNTAGLSSAVGKVTVAVVATDVKHTKGMLELQRHSCSVHYCTGDCTCAVLGQRCLLTSTQQNCTDTTSKLKSTDIVVHPGLEADTTVTSSSSCLTAHWEASSSQVLNSFTRFQWSIGKKGKSPGVGIFDLKTETVWREIGKRTRLIHCLPRGRSLQHGSEYIIHVKAWFSFSDYAVFQSHSILVDHTPPAVQRAKSPLDSDGSCKMDLEYFSHGQTVLSCWEGVFNDTQTTLTGFEIWVGTSPEGDDTIPQTSVGKQTSYTIPLAYLKSGTKYYSSIRATNSAGLQTIAVSDGFVVDDTPPVVGVVFNTDRHKNIEFQSSNTTLKASWHGFEDYHSYVQRFEIAIVKEGEHILDSMFKYHGMENEITIENLKLEEKKRYRIAVRAVDAAGLRSSTAESPSILIDTSASKAFQCTSFLDRTSNFTSANYTYLRHNSILLHTSEYLQKKTFYQMRVVGDLNIHTTNVIFTVGKLHIPAMFEKKTVQTLASHSFLAPNSGPTNISISITGTNISDALDVTLSECQNIVETNSENGITVWQIRPSVVAVCARVIDQESGTRSVWLGAGTSKGGYQIRALSPTSVSNHEMILVEEPHGSPVHVTVMAENNAGLRTIFTSKPITIDHTPPEIRFASSSLEYTEGSNTVSIKMTWEVEDDESGIDWCLCTYGTPHTYEPIWMQSLAMTSCEIQNIPAPQGSFLYAWVRCLNNVNMETTITSEALQVVYHPPALPLNSLKVLVDNQISSGLVSTTTQPYTDHIEFVWQNGNTPEIWGNECRLLEHGRPVADWVSTGKKTYATLDGLSLQDGHVYEIQVRAVNGRVQYSNILNSTITVESRSPLITGVEPTATLVNGHLTVDWSNVFDSFNMKTEYDVTIGTRQGFADIIQQKVTTDTYLLATTYTNEPGVFVTIKANTETGKFGIYSHFLALY
ncbi:uncharacterized protein LOC124134978 [Haliotis rufescens]|uniref:uncharacterized protein LOC124134978 n=1 Tax=Haliotis rufescens TaxID=6454 RepID=UPI00201EC064|nr:uncharacterized protein LOC124134978 [Haliotis rufescens]